MACWRGIKYYRKLMPLMFEIGLSSAELITSTRNDLVCGIIQISSTKQKKAAGKNYQRLF
jgi:hypothetical protein